MTIKRAIKDPSWLLARMSNQKVEGNDGPGFRHVRCPKMLWEELVRLVEGLKGPSVLTEVQADRYAAFDDWYDASLKRHKKLDELPFSQRAACEYAFEAGIESATALKPVRCNRCQANLCYEHDNCTDWTCARACSKCAKGPREQELSPFAVSGGTPPGTVTGWETPQSVGFTFDEAAPQPPQELVDVVEMLSRNERKLRNALEEIVSVASGERQVANDDTEGMEWIDKRARAALTRGAVGGTK